MGSYDDGNANRTADASTARTAGGSADRSADGTAPGGLLALSTPYRIAAALALALVAVVATVHIGMVFLHVAPANTASKRYGEAIDAWVYPEFEQNWKLFAPNPLQQNTAVEVRAEVRTPAGALRTTGWIGLTAEDARSIRGNPLPSHVHQNELRRAWDFYDTTHDEKNRATGDRGRLAERYLRRIAVLRLDRRDPGGTVERVRLRSVTTLVPAPRWSGEKTDTRPSHRLLPWWEVTPADRPAGAAARAPGDRGPDRDRDRDPVAFGGRVR
ncbi:DUF5819 family protein [Streptomyces sp. NPDC000594]|uniref:DUF5819 family protein n=1 Tax=Streptomyces sp. NPDC000594 TaxID=3154261 RepID=UPI0033210E3C